MNDANQRRYFRAWSPQCQVIGGQVTVNQGVPPQKGNGMSDDATALLMMFADEWQAYQHAVSAALAPLTPEQLALRAAPDLRSIGELACHIIGARAGWFSWVLDAGDQNFKAYEQWHKPAPGSAPKTASELVAGLAAIWQVMQQTMANYTLADLREEI